MTKRDHSPECTGWEDCQCFHVTLRREKYAHILAQRDRLAELLDQAYQHCSVNGHCELEEVWFDFVKKELSELDKEKKS